MKRLLDIILISLNFYNIGRSTTCLNPRWLYFIRYRDNSLSQRPQRKRRTRRIHTIRHHSQTRASAESISLIEFTPASLLDSFGIEELTNHHYSQVAAGNIRYLADNKSYALQEDAGRNTQAPLHPQ